MNIRQPHKTKELTHPSFQFSNHAYTPATDYRADKIWTYNIKAYHISKEREKTADLQNHLNKRRAL